eukprot:TRINITY_DN1933_c0_g2_i1.p1 TRINITY_DN1933_c0_g2~~TRINITY_DN1933_c0_g2_i1.p1  ORF type:complete len:147 (-),score=11.33 TRINITY_DN1933_c0_g2_i1:33-473(-)
MCMYTAKHCVHLFDVTGCLLFRTPAVARAGPPHIHTQHSEPGQWTNHKDQHTNTQPSDAHIRCISVSTSSYSITARASSQRAADRCCPTQQLGRYVRGRLELDAAQQQFGLAERHTTARRYAQQLVERSVQLYSRHRRPPAARCLQ